MTGPLAPSPAACWHEAAHAVVAHVRGLTVEALWVDGEAGRTHYRGRCPVAPTLLERAGHHWTELVVSVSGPVGELMGDAADRGRAADFPGWPPFLPLAGADDEADALRAARLPSALIARTFEPLPGGGPPAFPTEDVPLAKLHAGELTLLPPSVLAALAPDGPGTDWTADPSGSGLAIVTRAEFVAEDLLAANWPAVVAVARRLLRRTPHRLTGERFERLVGSHAARP